ncbi:MFS transporter [Streptomyces gibsoniae]|uniref:MFS transporter n=1 Tax=Streptomyces gibsoniae TaxID=3075529 RepID=A0ABU2U2X5_9ACTN|nr:MFS transporter [Streptomyces sp. DSM 41699]MDT0467401.1 MFS transporter [Streptomyces sp. DSM 41699]
MLTLIALLVPADRMADAHGRKLLYLYGFAVFTLASAACGFAPSLSAFVAFRVVQAAGAAMMQANSVALVTTSAPREPICCPAPGSGQVSHASTGWDSPCRPPRRPAP